VATAEQGWVVAIYYRALCVHDQIAHWLWDYFWRTAFLKEILRTVDPDAILALETDHWWLAQMQESEQTHSFTVYQQKF
jgi:hypothetical protein